MSKQQATQLDSARPVIVLVTICLVSGLLLGVAHALTQPVAEAVAAQRTHDTYAALVPEAQDFQALTSTVEGCTAAIAAKDASGQTVAYVLVAQAKCYGGDVPLAVAFSPYGSVQRVVALSNSETPGVGKRIAEDDFIGQFAGLPAQEVTTDQIDTISGATISSKAAIAAFDTAVQAFGEVQNQ